MKKSRFTEDGMDASRLFGMIGVQLTRGGRHARRDRTGYRQALLPIALC